MSTLYIRLPSKAAADNAPHWIALPCPYALVSHGDAIEREGVGALSELSDAVAKAQRTVLLLAASDVSLLRVKVPPISGARLKAALPNLVEDQLVSDPADCVVVAGPSSEGLRTVAVINRAWFEILTQTMVTYGARHITALPAQLCLPYHAGSVAAAAIEQGSDIDLALRLSELDGIGLPIMPEHAESASQDVVQTLCTLVPELPITLYVAQASVPAYQEAINTALALDQRITLFADNWSRWIAGATHAGLDLMAGLGAGAGPQFNWGPWRWAMGLAAAVLLVNIVGLNIEWWRMKHEADGLRASMNQTYKTAFPKETVIVDPLAQMNQKIAAAQRDAGQLAPDDFMPLAANFGEAWTSTAPGAGVKLGSAIVSIEYRERSLVVKLKPEAEAAMQQMKSALAARNLSLSQASGGAWQIRSVK